MASRLRRLSAFSAVVPLGVFLVEHLVANASAMGGAARFDGVVGAMARSPVFTLVELLLVAGPLAFHGAYGLWAARHPDREGHAYGSDRLYVAQRVSALVVAVFVVAHVAELRLARAFSGVAITSLYTRLAEHLSWTWQGVPWIALGYIVGLGATAFHFANGLFAHLAASGARPARRTSYAIVAFGAALGLLGTATVISVATGTRWLSPGDETGAAMRCGPDAPSPSSPSSVPPPQPSR